MMMMMMMMIKEEWKVGMDVDGWMKLMKNKKQCESRVCRIEREMK